MRRFSVEEWTLRRRIGELVSTGVVTRRDQGCDSPRVTTDAEWQQVDATGGNSICAKSLQQMDLAASAEVIVAGQSGGAVGRGLLGSSLDSRFCVLNDPKGGSGTNAH